MKKQLQLIISVPFMVLASLTGYSQNFTVEGIEYAINSTSPAEVEVVGYNTSSGTEVTILQKVNHNGTDYDVTAIGNNAFHNKQLTKVTFINTPSNVTRIGERAFRQNNLTEVEIPESVTSMEQGAFDKNDLTSVNIPKNITKIERWTFAANNLRELTIPANVATGTHSRLPNLAATQIIVAVDPRIACSAGVQSSSPMIPTAFTPNGDGANDHWIIDHLSEDASVRIYDRHGTIIFSSDDGYTRPWDGTSRGSSLPAGSYLYLIQNGPHTYRSSVPILL